MNLPEVCRKLRGKLVASCQASDGDAFRDPLLIARFAQAALAGGAAAIRADGPEDIRAIRNITNVPILGIQKVHEADGRILITPSFEGARELVEAGADLIALDATERGCRYGALARLRRIQSELNVPVLADIATVEEALVAAEAGAVCVVSTLRGYTDTTSNVNMFEPRFIEDLCRVCTVPVIAEGRIHTPEEASRAISAGAYAVVVGTAITRPTEMARRFTSAIENQFVLNERARAFGGIDLGGTQTKFGVVSRSGEFLFESRAPTPAFSGRAGLLDHLKRVATEIMDWSRRSGHLPSALGVATAGWVNATTGTVAYATDNLPGWTGTPIADELKEVAGIPVSVENDANALAVGEKHFGAGRPFNHFVCVTLGTGVGGGCYVAGTLNRGAHYFANALGHIIIQSNGLACTCGQRGCLEVYSNAAALRRYGGNRFDSALELIRAANSGDEQAASAVRELARHLALGCSSIVQLLDPEALILSGGLVQNNPLLLSALAEQVPPLVPAWRERNLQIIVSPLGYSGGVLGAAAVAIEHHMSCLIK
jgi:predicted NBD/HSP70 family sugar kinase/putative N-acetylmannosamine-6-phosphate epimerase